MALNPSPKILLIEDAPEIARLYRAALVQAGFQVFLAADGTKGLGIAKLEAPDLILLDLMLPGINGFEVLKIVRADPSLAAIPVIMYSGSGTPQNITVASQLGATAFVNKGMMTVKDLVEKICTALQIPIPSKTSKPK